MFINLAGKFPSMVILFLLTTVETVMMVSVRKVMTCTNFMIERCRCMLIIYVCKIIAFALFRFRAVMGCCTLKQAGRKEVINDQADLYVMCVLST